MKRALAKLLAAARDRGWSVDRTGSGHWKLKHESGAIYFTGGTPSCPRAVKNAEAALRRVERQVRTHA